MYYTYTFQIQMIPLVLIDDPVDCHCTHEEPLNSLHFWLTTAFTAFVSQIHVTCYKSSPADPRWLPGLPHITSTPGEYFKNSVESSYNQF